MKLKTIWTLPAMSLAERMRRTRDFFALKAVRFIPLRVRYWSTVLHVAETTSLPAFNKSAIGMISVTQMLDHIERPKVIR
jgi:hypothetical protein